MTSCTGAGGTGTKFTYAQLEGLWIQAGGSTALAPVMAAIAMAESGGCSAALNATDNGGTQSSWGLWQISNGTHSQPVAGILNPATNAQQAVAKYKSQGLNAWGTYDSGAYKAFISNGTTPDTSGISTDASTSSSASAGTYGTDCAVKFPGLDLGITSVGGGCLVTYGTERAIIAGLMLGGAGLLALAGFVILAAAGFGSTPAGRVVEAVTPVGRTVSAITPKRQPKP
jgi:hypothetical protein